MADENVTELRIAVAYMTGSGLATLIPPLVQRMGDYVWKRIPKIFIMSFDFGHTEPTALTAATSLPASSVRIANLGANGRIALFPPAAAFHAKMYMFCKGDVRTAFVGSANLSRRALSINTEVGAVISVANRDGMDAVWTAILAGSLPLDVALLESYTELRSRYSSEMTPPLDEPVPPEVGPRREDLTIFGEAVQAGHVAPESFNGFWVEAGSMSSSGSHAQLELPRRSNRFFGYEFRRYDGSQRPIGDVILTFGSGTWPRSLAWHGDNGMERINLPTPTMVSEANGLAVDYRGTAILFRRRTEGFEVHVAPWDGDEARAWRNESAAAGRTYRLGGESPRLCGLL